MVSVVGYLWLVALGQVCWVLMVDFGYFAWVCTLFGRLVCLFVLRVVCLFVGLALIACWVLWLVCVGFVV